jgi:hypothetical protein
LGMIALVVVLFHTLNKKIVKRKETKIATIIVTMMVTHMKYVINIKRKPSIIKKEREEKNTFIIYIYIWKIFFFISL